MGGGGGVHSTSLLLAGVTYKIMYKVLPSQSQDLRVATNKLHVQLCKHIKNGCGHRDESLHGIIMERAIQICSFCDMQFNDGSTHECVCILLRKQLISVTVYIYIKRDVTFTI